MTAIRTEAQVDIDSVRVGSASLEAERSLFGRGAHCDVVIDHPTVSVDHLEIKRYGTTWIATDLGSRNGTLLNGRMLDRPTRLNHGDTLLLGRARLTVSLPPALAASTAVATPAIHSLTAEERAVAGALVQQYRAPDALAPRPATRAEMADALHMSERTVQRRLDSLARKCSLADHGGRDRAQVLARAILEHGLDLG